MDILKLYEKSKSLPLLPGCYIMRDKSGKIIYIGKAKKLRTRVMSYFRDNLQHTAKVSRMVSLVDDFDVIETDSEFEALVLECSLIKQNTPKYNILLKDDKGFSYIKISSEPFPRITAELQKYDDGAKYIGPFMSSFGVKKMVETAVGVFKLPTCQKVFPRDFKKERPCLNAHIGKCMALCKGEVTQREYGEIVDGAVTMLTKGTDEILNQLRKNMSDASEMLEFERAARLRDSIIAIEKSEKGQKVLKDSDDADSDVFAFAANENCVCAVVLKFREGKLCDKDEQVLYDMTDIDEVREEFVSHYYINISDIPKKIYCDSAFDSLDIVMEMLSAKKGQSVSFSVPQRGEKRALVLMAYNNAADKLRRAAGRKKKEEAALGELANLLGLASIPEYIEAYDISNYGDEAVAGLVVFQNGFPKKSEYKRFIIKTVSGVDDYASMTEALTRRVKRFEKGDNRFFSKKPDIILIDGGKGHLSVAAAALADTAFADVPLFGMVKDDKHRTRGIVSKDGELSIALHKGAFSLITKIQDETHRFTVEYQRQSHSRNSLRSSLLDIEGVGEVRAKCLMKHFKTISAISLAEIEQLSEVPGIGKSAAESIYRHYHT
ncbi:MAG: excinuclease ABC subunit UvrC [Oscillospiraceae bacterium]